jgi:hypothetical protein
LLRLQGMPPPLSGCVWGLPMLPPPLPGFGGASMIVPASAPAPGQSFLQAGSMQWQAGATGAPAMHAAPTGSISMSTCMDQPAGVRMFTAPAPGAATRADGKGTAGGEHSKGLSATTWSHEPAETGIAGMAWHDVDMLDFDDDGNADRDDALHRFGAELLAGDPGAASGEFGAAAPGGPEAAVGGVPRVASKGALAEDGGMGGDALSWIEESYLIDDGLGEKGGAFLDMMA